MELGIYTFADVQPDKVSGKAMNAHQRIKNLMEEITLADQVGLDVVAVGEHHRPDYMASAPAVSNVAGGVGHGEAGQPAGAVMGRDSGGRAWRDHFGANRTAPSRRMVSPLR